MSDEQLLTLNLVPEFHPMGFEITVHGRVLEVENIPVWNFCGLVWHRRMVKIRVSVIDQLRLIQASRRVGLPTPYTPQHDHIWVQDVCGPISRVVVGVTVQARIAFYGNNLPDEGEWEGVEVREVSAA